MFSLTLFVRALAGRKESRLHLLDVLDVLIFLPVWSTHYFLNTEIDGIVLYQLPGHYKWIFLPMFCLKIIVLHSKAYQGLPRALHHVSFLCSNFHIFDWLHNAYHTHFSEAADCCPGWMKHILLSFQFWTHCTTIFPFFFLFLKKYC